jgi:hypothetical protein
VPAASARDRKAALATLEKAELVYALTRYPRSEVLDRARDVETLREGLQAIRDAARELSAPRREELKIPWKQLEDPPEDDEALWALAKKIAPVIIEELSPLVPKRSRTRRGR